MAHQEKIEGDQKKELLQSVDELISKKETARQNEGMEVVMGEVQNVKEGVGEVMAGMEVKSERVSERNREDKRGDLKTGQTVQYDDDDDQQAAQILLNLKGGGLPRQEIMVKKVRTAIRLQIKEEFKEAARLRKNLARGSAQEYSVKIAKIRGLQQVLKSIFNATFDKVKELYLRYFNADGQRKTSQ